MFCVCVCPMRVQCPQRSEESAWTPGSGVADVGPGNQTQAPCKNRMCSLLLSHLSSPKIHFLSLCIGICKYPAAMSSGFRYLDCHNHLWKVYYLSVSHLGWVKIRVVMHEYLSLNSQNHVKPGSVACIWSPSASVVMRRQDDSVDQLTWCTWWQGT